MSTFATLRHMWRNRRNPAVHVAAVRRAGRFLRPYATKAAAVAVGALGGMAKKYLTRKPPKARPAKVRGGYDSQSISIRHGKNRMPKPGFVKKVQEAVSQINYYNLKSVSKFSTGSSGCQYFGSPLLYYNVDMNQINYNTNGVVDKTFKFITDNAELTCSLTNASNAECYLRVYECQARHDIPIGVGTPIAVLNNGFTDSGYTNAKSDISATAFQSPEFCSQYKISNVRVIKFQPGEEKRFTLRDNSPCIINSTRISNAGASVISGLGKRTRFLLFQLWGQVAAASGTLSNLGTTANVMNCYWTLKYAYRWAQDKDISQYQGIATDASGNATAAVVLGTPAFIEEMTGLATTETDE